LLLLLLLLSLSLLLLLLLLLLYRLVDAGCAIPHIILMVPALWYPTGLASWSKQTWNPR
jgi:hypothetical protein